MAKIGARLVQIPQAEVPGGLAATQAAQLREHEPHPVAVLAAQGEFRQSGFDHRVLRLDEAVEIVWGVRERARRAGGGSIGLG